MPVEVTFDFHPDEPDDSDATGMSEYEYLRLTDALMEMGAENIKINRRRAAQPEGGDQS